MESSLININSASLEELQTIHGIGPSLASRIIACREKSGPIMVKEQLEAVRGLGKKQIGSMAQIIDWSISDPDARQGSVSPVPAWVISIAVFTILLFLIYPMAVICFEEFAHWENNIRHWHTTAVNLLSIIFTTSTVMLMLGWLLSIFYTRSSVAASIINYSFATVATSFLLLITTSLVGYWVLNTYTDVTKYMFNLMLIIVSVLLLVYLQYGPQLLCLTRHHLNEPASRFFDYSLLPLAVVLLLVVLLEPSQSPLVDIFMLWVGILMATYGLTISRRCSCYADLLHEIYTWPNIFHNNPSLAIELNHTIQNINKSRSQHREFTLIGRTTIAISSTISLYSLYELTRLAVLN